MHSTFIPGRQLAARFYDEAVRPILDAHFPALKYAAALIDSGSEVLGFDDGTSTDHHWGPRVQLFVGEADRPSAEAIKAALARHLPYEFLGYPTSFTEPNLSDNGTQHLQRVTGGPVKHRVEVRTARDFLQHYLGFDVEQPLEAADWLTFSEQRLRTVTAGPLFHDDVGLGQVRARLVYYPRDVWLYVLAAGWARIGQEEHLMGRAGVVGDEVGSALIGARLVRDVMRLWFMMARTYAPYPKWFGTAFKLLPGAGELWPVLQGALRAEAWPQRERHLVTAYEALAARHNALTLTEPRPEHAAAFHGRPFQVIDGQAFANALVRQIEDPAVKAMAARPLIGGIDLLSDNTDFVSDPFWRVRARPLYQSGRH